MQPGLISGHNLSTRNVDLTLPGLTKRRITDELVRKRENKKQSRIITAYGDFCFHKIVKGEQN